MVVRPEGPGDREAIRRVHERAFPSPAEALLVDRLRDAPDFLPELSLVAEEIGGVVGHVLLSRVTVDSRPAARVLGLGPIGVLPEQQRAGMGAALMREAIDRASRLGYDGIVLLGHPEYYPRFGFRPASGFGLSCVYEVPDEAFMALELRPGALEGDPGLVRYSAAFDDL